MRRVWAEVSVVINRIKGFEDAIYIFDQEICEIYWVGSNGLTLQKAMPLFTYQVTRVSGLPIVVIFLKDFRILKYNHRLCKETMRASFHRLRK